MSHPTQSHEVARKRKKLRLQRQIYHILRSTQHSAQLVAKNGAAMASPSEGPPHPINFAEMHRRRASQPFGGPAGGAHNSLPQCSKMEVSDMAASASAPYDVTYAFQPQHCDLSRIHQRHSSLQSGTPPVFPELNTKSTSTREIATSPLRSSHLRRAQRDVDITRTDYLRALTSIVLNHSAAKMSAQLSKKMSVPPKKRAVYTPYKARTFVPRYLQRRTPPFQAPKSSRPSPQAAANDGRTKTNNVTHKRGERTDPTTRKRSSSSDKSKATDQSLPPCRERKKTPPVLVQCSGETVTRNCELMKETPQIPATEVAEISGQIYTKCEEDSPNNPPEVPPIIIQCDGETIEKRCVQIQTLPSALNVDEKAESSKSTRSAEKARSIKRKKQRKTVIGKIGFSKSFFLSKKRARRPEGRRIKPVSRNTDPPSTSSGSTPSRQVHESHSSKATSSWRDQPDHLDKTSSFKRRVTFNDERGRELRLRRLRKRRRSKSVSGHAPISKSSMPQKAVESTRFEDALNHLRYTGNKVKESFLQAEKHLSSKNSPEESPSGLRQDEHLVSSNTSHTLQTAIIANRCGLAQAQMYPSGYAGTVYDPRNNLPMKREKDMHSSLMKTSKHPEGGNQTAKANFVNRSRDRDYGSGKKSIETCRNDIKRLADATRCFLKYRKNIGTLEKTQNLTNRGRTNALGTEVTAPPALPPEESTISVLLPAGMGKSSPRCVELLSNVRQQGQVHNRPAQPTKALGTVGPHSTNLTIGSTGKKAPSRSRYCSPKQRGDFHKYAPMSNPTKTATHDKRRGSISTHHDKKLSSLEVVEQWLHSSAASSQQGDGPEPLPSVEQGLSDLQLRPSTRDIATMATPRMMRQATYRNRHFSSKKPRSSSTNLSLKKTKSKKPSADTNNLDPNAFRYKSIDAHARCLELLENSSYSLTSEVANQLDPLYDRKQASRNTETRKRKTHTPCTDLVLQRVLQEHTPTPHTHEQATMAHNARPGQMVGTSHHSTPNVKLRGNTSSNSPRMRFTSTVPKATRGKANKMPAKGPDAKAVPFEGPYKAVERNGDSGVDCPVDTQINAVDRTRLPDISAQALSNPTCSEIIPGDPQSNLTANENEAKQMEKKHLEIGDECKMDIFHCHGNRSSRHGMSFWPKRRISVCGKRLSGMPRRYRAPQWTDSLRKGTSASHREHYMTSSGFNDLKQMDNESVPNVHECEEKGRENSEAKLMNHISGPQKERISSTMEKLSRITRWNSTNRRGSHSSVSSRKTEMSSYSDVSGSTFSDTGKSNNCIPTRGFNTAVLVPKGPKSPGQEAVSATALTREMPRLIVQCTGGTITPQPLPAYQLTSVVPKTTERMDTGKQEEKSPTKEPSQMVVSISWGGTCCNLQCHKGPSSETTQVLTLPPIVANIKDGIGNNTTKVPAHVPAENDAKRQHKRRPTSPGITPSKRADVSNCKGKMGRPTSRTGTPKTKQQASVPTVSWATSRRGNPQPNSKPGAQSKKDKAAVEVKGSESSPPAPSRGMRQRSKPTLPGPGVTNTPSPCRKVSPPLRKNVPLSRSVGPSRGHTTRKVDRTGKERSASVQVSETVNASVQVSRQHSAATASSRKGSSNAGDDKRDRTTSVNRQKSAGTSPEDSSKLVEAYVQTSEETPGNSLKSILGVGNYLQINPLMHNQNVAVSVQTSGMAFPEKVDASFQTSMSRTLIPPKIPTNLSSGDRWNSDFFMQTQRYLSNVATVLASQKIKALSRSEEEAPTTTDPPAEVQIILPERKGRETSFRETRTERQERRSSSSSSTADASIQTPKSSAKPTPKTSSVLIQRTLRDAANLLQRHRSLSAPQAPVAEKRHVLMEEMSGMGGPPPWPVRSGPIRECDTPSAAVTSNTTSTSSVISPSESKSIPKKTPRKDKDRNKYSGLDSSKPLPSSEKVKNNPSPPLKRSPNASQCITGATHNVYGYQRRGGSSSVLVNRVEKVTAPQWKKGDQGNSTSPKARTTIHSNRSPITSPTKGYLNKVHGFGDPIKPPLPPPRKLTMNPSLMPSATPTISGHSSRSSNSMPRKLLQILQSRNPSRPKPLVMRRSKKTRGKAPNRKTVPGSVQPAKQSAPAVETSAGAAQTRSGSSTPHVPQQADPAPGNKDGETGPQASKTHRAQDEKATLQQGAAGAAAVASTSAQQRSRSTGASSSRVRQTPGSLLVVMPRVTDSPPQLRPRPAGV